MAKRTPITDERRARLLEMLEQGKHTVYTTVTHVARSGMSRDIRALVIVDGEPRDISYLVAEATGNPRTDRGVHLGGCGMDMGFALVYDLSRVLWPEGHGCTGEGCTSNDHSNGDRDYTPHMDEKDRVGADGKLCTCHKTHWHRDGGYRLRQRWL